MKPGLRWLIYRLVSVILFAGLFTGLRPWAAGLFVLLVFAIAAFEPVDRKGRKVRFGIPVNEQDEDLK